MMLDYRQLKCIIPYLTGFITIISIPNIHIGIVHSLFWVPNKPAVNRKTCSCSCWDTIFKGSYESGMRVGYKHLYFNSTWQILVILIITTAAVLAFYEGITYVVRLYASTSLRYSMSFLLVLDIHAHYYSWWMYVNYFNDDFYSQIYHQTFFTVTEIVSSGILFSMCSTKHNIPSWKITGVLSISAAHLIVGGLDQFIRQLIFFEGQTFQRFRNLGFLIPDVLHMIIPIKEYKRTRVASATRIFTKQQLTWLTMLVVFQVILGKYLLN